MRERTTWNRSKIAENASRGRSKVADPYTLNTPEHTKVQPSPDAYVTGTPSDFAEDVHPSAGTWEAEYSNGQVKRNEIGEPEFRGDTWNHPERTASIESVTQKAQFAILVAKKMLPRMASADLIENQALSLMYLPDADLNATFVRLAAEEQDEEGEDDDKKPWEQGSKEAAEQEGQDQGGQSDQSKQAQDQGQQKAQDEDETSKEASLEGKIARAVQAALAPFVQALSKKAQGQGEKAQDQGHDEQSKQAQAQDQGQQQTEADKGQQKQAGDPPFEGAAPPFGKKDEKDGKDEGQDKQATIQQLTAEVQSLMARLQKMAQGHVPPVQANGDLIDDMLMNDPCQQDSSSLGLDLDSPMVDVGEVQLGPEDAELMQLFANGDESEEQQQEQQQKQASAHAVRTAATRTVGTRPTQGVSRIGSPGGSSQVDTRLQNLWKDAPDVSEAFGIPSTPRY